MSGELIPSLSEVRKLVGRGNVVPVYREVRADLETPVSAFLKVAQGDYSFLLESVEGGETVGRYSFIGTEPYRVLACDAEDGDPESAFFDVENVISHEFGHVAGLGHVNAPKDGCLTMYALSGKGEIQKRDLGFGDQLGMDVLYGTDEALAADCLEGED